MWGCGALTSASASTALTTHSAATSAKVTVCGVCSTTASGASSSHVRVPDHTPSTTPRSVRADEKLMRSAAPSRASALSSAEKSSESTTIRSVDSGQRSMASDASLSVTTDVRSAGRLWSSRCRWQGGIFFLYMYVREQPEYVIPPIITGLVLGVRIVVVIQRPS